MVNASLSQERLPESQKHAVVSPRLKKRGLDTSNMANFRPVSHLTFMSKVVERAVAKQLNEYLTANDLLPRFQSAFRKQHSTETAMLWVLSDALTVADSQRVTLLGLLDLSAAFDCVDRSLLLLRLQRNFGLVDTVLRWFTSLRQNSTDVVRRSSVSSHAAPEGVCPRTSAVCHVHCRS